MAYRNKSVDVHRFAMVPRPDVPRASFRMQKTLKTTFDAGLLVPVFCEEVLPGDTFNARATFFARMATPIFPFMDNVYLDSFFFFVPNRLVWANWKKFMGEQVDPADSISFTVPQVVSPSGGWTIGSLADYFGLPTAGQVAASATVTHSALPLRAYRLIFQEWFRDQNLVTGVPPATNDGPDPNTSYTATNSYAVNGVYRRGKRHDYFTSALPWPQKGNTSVSLPLGTTAPVRAFSGADVGTQTEPMRFKVTSTGAVLSGTTYLGHANGALINTTGGATQASGAYPYNLQADLSAATAATINQLRQAFQIQKLLERDARGGTRYTEIVRAHFGVISPDARLQRPEYLGGGSQPVSVNPIAQTSETGTTPQGKLAAMATSLGQHGFTQSFTEHGYVIGIVSVRADLTYQQGLRRHWSRSTRYDFYFPAFAHLGEQAVLNKEIYVRGTGGSSDGLDDGVFGYQERWAEYRYVPSEITGLFRSTAAGTIDPWHLAQNFTSRPTLNSTFISESPPISRVVAVGGSANGQQFIMDAFYDIKAARPLPLYSVPGLIDHF